MIELGQKGRDKITGFEGIIVGRVQYLFGCNQYLLVPPVKSDGTLVEGQWFDEGRIEVIGSGITADEVRAEKPGGLNRDCPKRRV